MFIGNVPAIGFKRSMLALSISAFSPLMWASDVEVKQAAGAAPGVGIELSEVNGARKEAVTVNGVAHTVDSAALLESYSVINGGMLNIESGGVVERVLVADSKLNINGGVALEGIKLLRATASINGARIISSKFEAIQLGADDNNPLSPATAHVADSHLRGAGYGALVSPAGELWLERSLVEGVDREANDGSGGISLAGGIVHVRDSSHVTGNDSGVRIFNGTKGHYAEKSRLEIDNSTITARVGAAIKVIKSPEIQNEKTTADILIANHSILEAGNGRIVDVKEQSTAKVEVNDSALNGDFVADDTCTLNVVLRNHGRLDGNIINGNSVIIDSSGHWQLKGDNEVKSLAIDGGSVGFSEEGFHTLTLGQLSGRGRFDMHIDLANAAGDLLNVEGDAWGKHLLNIRNTGEETMPSEFDALRVVHTEGGDAQFRLRGARADLGAYSYELEQQGNDWFIVGSGKIISPSTESVLALFNVGPTIWNSELSTLRSRMGEVRGQEHGGGWMRSYGSRFNASLETGLDYQQKQRGLSFGADAPVQVPDGKLLVGLMVGYSKSDLDMGRGTSGKVDSYYLGAYGTWLSEEGYYLDGILKVNQFHNASKVAMSDGEKAKGDYSNMALGGSVEFGKHIKLPDEYFVAPFAQLSSVWIGGDSYTLDNGLRAKNSQTQSILGKVGATLGRQFTLADGGVLQPYVRVAGAHEFSRSNNVRVNDQRFDNDLFGSRAELGAGMSVSLSERLQVHADFDYMKGEHVEQPWGANVGLRLAF